MSAFQPCRSGIHFKSKRRGTRGRRCMCEAVESRWLLSTATFATPTSVSVPGARAPLVSSAFDGPGNPLGLAVATATSVQILNGSSSGAYTLGASIPLPADPASVSPFETGNYTGSNVGDIVLDSYNPGTGDGKLTYETCNGNGTFTQGSVTPITDGGAGFTPIAGRSADFNGDGETDLAVIGKPGTGSELVLAVMISNGDGTFTEADYPIAGSNAAGNVSNEEVLTSVTDEIIVYDGSGGNLDVFSGIGDGTFTQLTPTPLAASLVTGGTFNDNQDLVVANGDQISLLVNQGDGTFQPQPQGPITLDGTIDALNVGDMNLDGNADIITNQGILFGNGDETFNTTAELLPFSISGGGGVVNTVQAVNNVLNGRDGLVGFAAAGNAILSAVNQTPVGVSIDLSSSNNPANPGADIQFTASVSSADLAVTATPTGTVTFLNGTTAIGMASLVDGTATFDAGSSLPGGASSITAQYNGDSKFGASTSMPLTQTVLAPTVTTVTSNENPSLAGDDVVFTAVVTGNDGLGDIPSGNVEFFDNGTDLGGGELDDTGTATFDTTGSLAVGSHPITAQYQDDSNFSPSESTTLTQAVNQPGLVPAVSATTLPTGIVAGTVAHGTVTITLTNQTSAAVLADSITAFASTNGVISGATPLISETFKHGTSIDAGQTKVLKLTVKRFPSIADGAYRLLVQVSSSLSQTSNSVNGPTVSIAAPFVHLAGPGGTSIVTPKTIKAGKSITLTLDLTNSGNIITTNATLDIGLSIDGETESIPLETVPDAIRIKPGKTGVIRVHVKIPLSVLAGSYDPFISVTDDGDVTTIIGEAFVVET